MSSLSQRHSNRFIAGGLQRGNTGPLSDDQLRKMAPSIFAIDKHASRSERYTYIPTSEIVSGLRANGFVPVHARQGGSRVEGKADFTKHLVRFRQADAQPVARLGGLFPEVILRNSHDGTSAYHLMAGMYRLICLNGLYVAEETFGDLRVPHKGDIVGQVIEGSFEVIETSRAALGQAEEWADIRVPREAALILADEAHALRFPADDHGNRHTPIQPEQLLAAGAREDRADASLWGTYNRIQSGIIQGGLTAFGRNANGQRRRVTTRPVTGIDGDIKLNRSLARLTERMAELLGGRAAA